MDFDSFIVSFLIYKELDITFHRYSNMTIILFDSLPSCCFEVGRRLFLTKT